MRSEELKGSVYKLDIYYDTYYAAVDGGIVSWYKRVGSENAIYTQKKGFTRGQSEVYQKDCVDQCKMNDIGLETLKRNCKYSLGLIIAERAKQNALINERKTFENHIVDLAKTKGYDAAVDFACNRWDYCDAVEFVKEALQ